jgi:TetR/AcrR family transcriptional regulator, cholesterol catabolism regulator
LSPKADEGDARERVMDAAERLFAQRGYASVTLREIAAEVGIRHTSLYHHVPGGKEELFVDVTERSLQRHHAGLTKAIATAGSEVRARLFAASSWLLSQPPMDLVRMVYADMPAIAHAHAERLSRLTLETLIKPIEAVLVDAQRRGEIEHQDLGLVAGGLFGMIESLHAVPAHALRLSRPQMAHELIDVLLNGLRRRSQ